MACGKVCAHRDRRAQLDGKAPDQSLIRLAEQLIGFGHAEACYLDRFHPRADPIRLLDLLLYFGGNGRWQPETDMDRGGQSCIQVLVSGSDGGFDRADHVADHIFRGIVQQGRQLPFGRDARRHPAEQCFHQKRMLGHRIGMITARLPVPARDEGKAVGNILDLDIDRGWIQQVKTAA